MHPVSICTTYINTRAVEQKHSQEDALTLLSRCLARYALQMSSKVLEDPYRDVNVFTSPLKSMVLFHPCIIEKLWWAGG
ncbi:hypothetical protein EVAR_49663_1 [Eumeta japonica]|uniref:Uncharacterized protein n=1 Tax=Eumeta variegata TaxID=151549 RepID=A0A4C1Y861_EUMVA|nr:hypothetical protein EVAR_49663_1 [Eumeta japonica]